MDSSFPRTRLTDVGSPFRLPNINNLPDELMVMVLSHLSIEDLINSTQHVSIRWRRLSHDLAVWRNRGYHVDYESDEDVASALVQMPSLHAVSHGRIVGVLVFTALQICRHLVELRFSEFQLLNCSIMQNLVERCPNIQRLTIPDQLLHDDCTPLTVCRLQQLRALEVLTRLGSVDTVWLKALAHGCPKLCSVVIELSNHTITDVEYFLRAKGDTLRHITTDWTATDGRSVVPLLTVYAPNLEYLRLLYYEVNPNEAWQTFESLGRLRNLRRLDLSSADCCPPEMFILPFISGDLSGLQKLDLSNNEESVVDETVVAVCRACPNLTVLRLCRNVHLTDEALVEVHRLVKLELLDLAYCKGLRGTALKNVSHLLSLVALGLEDMDLVRLQPGWECVTHLTKLRELILSGCHIPSTLFDCFPGSLFSLRFLYVTFSKVDDLVLNRLLECMPALKVVEEGTVFRFSNPCEVSLVSRWE